MQGRISGMMPWKTLLFVLISFIGYQASVADVRKCTEDLYKEDIHFQICHNTIKIGGSVRCNKFFFHGANAPWNNLMFTELKVVILIHGFDSNEEDYRLKSIGTELLHRDLNVGYFALVQWHKLIEKQWFVHTFGYYDAKLYTEMVGTALECFLNTLTYNYEINVKNIHLIGHGVGAQIAGFGANRYRQNQHNKVGRISALDPTNYLYYEDKRYRIHKDHANFVDVILTNRGKSIYQGAYGYPIVFGHATFLPNGGRHQPMCSMNTLFAYYQDVKNICSHSVAIEYYLQSIKFDDICKFHAFQFKSSNIDDPDTYDFDDKNIDSSSIMGYFAVDSSDICSETKMFYLDTNPTDGGNGFCKRVNVTDLRKEPKKLKESAKNGVPGPLWIKYQITIVPVVFLSIHSIILVYYLLRRLKCPDSKEYNLLTDLSKKCSSLSSCNRTLCSVCIIGPTLFGSLAFAGYVLLPLGWACVFIGILILVPFALYQFVYTKKNGRKTLFAQKIIKSFVIYNIVAILCCIASLILASYFVF